MIESVEYNRERQMISYCGLDCEASEARLATVKNDEALRQRVAKEWSELNGTDGDVQQLSGNEYL